DLSQVKSARLVFNHTEGASAGSGNVTVNGTNVPVTLTDHPSPTTTDRPLQTEGVDVPVSLIRQGANTFTFNFGSGQFIQVELEVTFNRQRVIGNPPVNSLTMLNLTATNFRFERTNSDPLVMNGTTNLYDMGGVSPATYTAQVITPDSPWLKITSPTTGSVASPALGGGVTPVNFTVDFSNYGAPSDINTDGDIGIIKVTGGTVPLYTGVI